MEKKKVIFVVSLLMIACYAFADKYKVLYVNSRDIKVGNKTIVVGNVFDDKEVISWTSDQQAMKVMNLSTNRMMVLAAKALKKKNVSSLYDYLTSTKRLSTRNFRKKRIIEEWQLDSTLYLMDALYIRMPKSQPKSVVAKIIVKKGEVKEIPLNHDGHYYILSRDIYGNSYPHPLMIDIREYDPKQNWEYTTYRNLIIEPLPIK